MTGKKNTTILNVIIIIAIIILFAMINTNAYAQTGYTDNVPYYCHQLQGCTFQTTVYNDNGTTTVTNGTHYLFTFSKTPTTVDNFFWGHYRLELTGTGWSTEK